MTPLITTIDTLFDTIINFATRLCLYVVASQPDEELPKETVVTVELPIHTTKVEDTETEPEKQTFKAIADILKVDTYAVPSAVHNTIMYAGTLSVPLYKNPTVEFDTQIATIPYGEMVMMLEPRGRFFRVIWGTIEGWVVREDLADRAVRVYPEFIVGHENVIDHPNTAHIRAILNDPFGLNHSEYPLQAGEYVLYKLWRKGVHINWPQVRPRTPGLWHKILKGVQGVHIGVTPKVGSIMEYLFENEVGHLVYVEAVFPDNTVTISEVNYPDSGLYNERELTRDEWKELKPVFMSVA
jgi:hypothetical protein